MSIVAHATSVHDASDVRIVLKEAQSLADAGHDVTVVVPESAAPLGSTVKFKFVKPTRSRFARWFLVVPRVFKATYSTRAKIVHIHDPELIPVGIIMRMLGKAVVFDAHEDVAAQVKYKSYIPPPLRKPASVLASLATWLAGRTLSGVVAATPAIAKGFPAHKTVVVQNFPLPGELVPSSGTPYADRRHWFVYAGGLAEERGALTMAEAMRAIKSDACLEVVGTIEHDVEVAMHQQAGPRIVFRGQQSRAFVAEAFGRARAGLVLFHPLPNHVEAQPNKMFEYMSAGLPIIASDFPLWREIVERYRCGLVVDPLDPGAIAVALEQILEDPTEAEAMGRRGAEAVASTLNWPAERINLIAFYERFTK